MKTTNNTVFNEETKVCVMRCFYDEEGEYCEEYMEGIETSTLPEKASGRLDLRYDINTLYSKWDVLVVARSISEIDEYKKIGATTHFFHRLLHIGEDENYDGYMIIVSNLKTLRKWYKNRIKNTG
jgi:hypothetical protein